MLRTLLFCSLSFLSFGCSGKAEEPAPVWPTLQAPPPPPQEVPEDAEAQDPADRPDIILIVADDMGAGDWQVGNPKLTTPNLMSLCDEGVRLDRYYTLPLCTPTRTAMLTGQSPLPFHMAFSPMRRWEDRAIPQDVDLLPEYLKEAGYATGIIGKWHLGHRETWMLPNQRGFDYFYGFLTGAIHYFTHKSGNAGLDWQRNGESLDEKGYTTTLFGDDAARWIAAQEQEQPLFLYLPFNAPHSPTMAPAEFTAPFKDAFPDLGRRRYCGMVSAMDQSIGKVLAAVEERGKAENTLIIFVSDNGASIRENGSNGPLRGTKGTVFEGAIRTPGVVKWPGRIPVGVESPQLVDVRDWFPTILIAAGVDVPEAAIGMDVIPTLSQTSEDEATARRGDLFYASNIASYLSYAMIRWPYKCVVRVRHKTGKTERQLYRLDLDPLEKENLRTSEPQRLGEMEEAILDWFAEALPGERFESPVEIRPNPSPDDWEEPADWTAPPPLKR
ncbi:MAG: arylsulfatase B [Planctomycetota bacterium]